MGVIVAKLYDLASNELADITGIALEKSMQRRLNQARTFTITAPAGSSLLAATAGDGYPNLRKGNRKLIVWEDGVPIFHGRVLLVERTGDGTVNRVAITAQDPLMELGFDPDHAGRPVRDSTGNFIDPTFKSSLMGGGTEVSGPDLIQQVLTTSEQTGDESSMTPGEGPHPIDLTLGTFDLDVPPAVDLNPVTFMDWPVLIGDFIQTLTATGVVDINLAPLDIGDVADPYKMVSLSAVSHFGTDKSATVHFDYWTGSKNASACRHVEDFSTIDNKLYDYLGGRNGQEHWGLGNITPGSPGTLVDPSASRALYGEFMSIRVFDFVGRKATVRPLGLALWNAEQGFRVEPRDLLFITPSPDTAGLFDAPADFDVGDLIAVNTGGAFGLALAENQRLYGYTKTWSREGVARLSELITSAVEA